MYEFNDILTNLFKEILLNNNLYKSGDLYNSIQIFIGINLDRLVIKIESLEYLQFLWNDYDLYDKFINHFNFKNVIETFIQTKINSFYGDFEDNINELLNVIDASLNMEIEFNYK